MKQFYSVLDVSEVKQSRYDKFVSIKLERDKKLFQANLFFSNQEAQELYDEIKQSYNERCLIALDIREVGNFIKIITENLLSTTAEENSFSFNSSVIV